MKFFKHFTDAHEGRSLMTLFDKMGHTGIACYWILVELCASKIDEMLERKAGERITEADLEFTFHPRLVRQKLRISQAKVELFLGECSTLNLLSFEIGSESVKIFMPKLLKCLERAKKKDVKTTSVRRQFDVLDKDKEQEEDKDRKSAPKPSDAEKQERRVKFNLAELYGLYPRHDKKSVAIDLLAEYIATDSDREAWRRAIQNYADHCHVEGVEWKYTLAFSNFAADWEHWRDFKPRKLKAVGCDDIVVP